ncbi:MAG: FAD-dependent oxidoreductase [Syntrophobacterales bacterium]|jgi:heterodisulfide reductase subunit A|nr:FAD-dependent oxidoreductase [Syntrophobacterales bacterium]
MITEQEETAKQVLVVGGGIGGITAALELASCGVNVTMLEEGPSIGGRMIQLDKTFPTLDCSTCTLSPKMVEVALQKKIELFSWAKPVAVRKEGKGFTVTIIKKSRYVDIKKCTACGSCWPGCPVVMKSEFNMGTGPRKAIYIPFPQAIPNKASIDKREDRPCKAACVDACPIHTNVLGYVKHISEGRFNDAYMLIKDTNPFPSVCGRVCYAPCEMVCNRGQMDDPLAIRDLKRFAVDRFDLESLEPSQVQKTGRKVAVIGAGPAGLACAHDCAQEGHDVTVFEALPEPGGMLRYAIPEYRLPKAELSKEISYIEKLGVTIKCGLEIGKDITLEDVKNEYEALFIGTGAPKGLLLGIEGEGFSGVIDGIRFLRAVNSGEAVSTGNNVVVVGGGNTAVDCARTAKRVGGEPVTLIYRRTRDEMPAADEEIEALLHEGVEIKFLTAPVRFLDENGRLSSIECIRMELGDADESGRRRPVPVKGSEFTLSVDTVITALGQATQVSFVGSIGISIGRNETIIVDPATGATNMESIFAGGDVTTGPAYVVDAIAAGKKAARSISKYLKGEPVTADNERKKPEKLSGDELDAVSKRFAEAHRLPMPEEAEDTRIADFREVTLGYTQEDAMKEASRCLAGQIEGCIQCGECEKRCEVKAVDYQLKDEIVELQFDSILLAPGFDLYDPTEKKEYGYGVLEGVMTGIEFERVCSVTGPTGGDIQLKGVTPKRFYFIQCVGSRDRQSGARFCSRVCCMYTAKHASIVKDRIVGAEIYVSYIDVRAYGKNYEEFYKSTQESGTYYIRGIPGEIVQGEKGLLVRVEDMLSGEMIEVEVDLVVLATGVRPRKQTAELCDIMSVERDEYGFIKVSPIAPSETNVEGIFVCGMASGPKDVPDTVASGGEAASRCMEYMSK